MKTVVDAVAGLLQSIDESLALDPVLLDIKRSIQLDDYSCGAQSAFMILRYFGKARSVTAVARAVGTNEGGTTTRALLKLFRKRKLKPVIKANATLDDLRSAIADGAPSLVSLDGNVHWGVVYGYSSKNIYLADPSLWKSIRVGMSVEKFLDRWDRWAMIVSSRSPW
jgi:ABC-type bacteriocin/lantibiotic exporter with double-glycine peptidase domain